MSQWSLPAPFITQQSLSEPAEPQTQPQAIWSQLLWGSRSSHDLKN